MGSNDRGQRVMLRPAGPQGHGRELVLQQMGEILDPGALRGMMPGKDHPKSARLGRQAIVERHLTGEIDISPGQAGLAVIATGRSAGDADPADRSGQIAASTMGSSQDGWLKQMMYGPLAGSRSAPSTRNRT